MRLGLVLFLVGFLVVAFCFSSLVSGEQDAASAAISAAQSKLVSCFNAARAAEAAGANISKLTGTLDSAGVLLSNAQNAYSAGDSSKAQSLAVNCSNVLNGFVSEANSLRSAAVQSSNFSFWVDFVGSIVGAVAVVVGSVGVWVWLKRKYGSSGVSGV